MNKSFRSLYPTPQTDRRAFTIAGTEHHAVLARVVPALVSMDIEIQLSEAVEVARQAREQLSQYRWLGGGTDNLCVDCGCHWEETHEPYCKVEETMQKLDTLLNRYPKPEVQ